jgi:hypothetical protein
LYFWPIVLLLDCTIFTNINDGFWAIKMNNQLKKNSFLLLTVFLAVFILSGCSADIDQASKNQPATYKQEQNQSSVKIKENATSGQNTTNSASCGEDYYRNAEGNCVHRPSDNPSGASAKCRDGSYSYSQHRQGTCSGHGGVAQWL